MPTDAGHKSLESRSNPFTAADTDAILRARGWLTGDASPELAQWLADAAALLGPHAADRDALENLLALVFHYDAAATLRLPENHAVMTRQHAREVVRALAHFLLDGAPLDSERLKEIVAALKERVTTRNPELFHPLRLALAGRSGDGALDRVILLLDRAAALDFAVPVKSNRRRIAEFCAALD
jgi:hypothetical protein